MVPYNMTSSTMTCYETVTSFWVLCLFDRTISQKVLLINFSRCLMSHRFVGGRLECLYRCSSAYSDGESSIWYDPRCPAGQCTLYSTCVPRRSPYQHQSLMYELYERTCTTLTESRNHGATPAVYPCVRQWKIYEKANLRKNWGYGKCGGYDNCRGELI